MRKNLLTAFFLLLLGGNLQGGAAFLLNLLYERLRPNFGRTCNAGPGGRTAAGMQAA